jgi:hypothetical protein
MLRDVLGCVERPNLPMRVEKPHLVETIGRKTVGG